MLFVRGYCYGISKHIHFEEVIITTSCNHILLYFCVKTCCSTLTVFAHGLCYSVLFSLVSFKRVSTDTVPYPQKLNAKDTITGSRTDGSRTVVVRWSWRWSWGGVLGGGLPLPRLS